MAAHHEPFRLAFRMTLRLGASEIDPLRAYAQKRSLTLGEATRRVIRTGLASSASVSPDQDDADRGRLLEELAVLNLIVAEQTLKLLETISPQGPGSADELLVIATESAQRRLARGLSAEAGWANDRN
jgi:hypothetical protein